MRKQNLLALTGSQRLARIECTSWCTPKKCSIHGWPNSIKIWEPTNGMQDPKKTLIAISLCSSGGLLTLNQLITLMHAQAISSPALHPSAKNDRTLETRPPAARSAFPSNPITMQRMPCTAWWEGGSISCGPSFSLCVRTLCKQKKSFFSFHPKYMLLHC